MGYADDDFVTLLNEDFEMNDRAYNFSESTIKMCSECFSEYICNLRISFSDGSTL